MPRIDRVGQVFDRLTVVKFHSSDGKRVRWECKCICGNTSFVIADNLTSGVTKSCGCLKRELTIERKTKHGNYSKPFYRRYVAMVNRCNNPDNASYYKYGGRGIKVCDRWLEPDGKGFLNFLEDMMPKAETGVELDRIDNNGDYEPSNCRWVTTQQNSFNTRDRGGTSKYKGVSWSTKRKKWVAQITVDGVTKNLGGFVEEKEAALAYNKAAKRLFGEYANLNDFKEFV